MVLAALPALNWSFAPVPGLFLYPVENIQRIEKVA
jgi:hypothetical protein